MFSIVKARDVRNFSRMCRPDCARWNTLFKKIHSQGKTLRVWFNKQFVEYDL